MDIKISKGDIIWSYLAQFLQMASGLLVLPYVLKMLSAQEVGFNYIMLTIGSMVALIDFGFAPQFGRNISYIYGGAQKLCKEGVIETKSDTVNWNLLYSMITVSKKVYTYLSLAALLFLLTIGTLYVYYVTDAFTSVESVVPVWIVYAISTYLNLYVSYYNALLTGAGKIKESKQAIILSRILYLLISYLLLYYGFGLMGLSVAYLIQPVIVLLVSRIYFYDSNLKKQFKGLSESNSADNDELFRIVWYNAKKLGINNLGAYGITKMGMFLAGLYLSLEEMSSYGLMVQLLAAIGAVSMIVLNSYIPQISAYRVSGDNLRLISRFSVSMIVFYTVFTISVVLLIFLGPWLLESINSSSKLPSTTILVIYSIVILLEQNHTAFASIIVTKNTVPFVKAGLLAGLFITIFSYMSLTLTDFGILGLVLVQGICQAVYNNWKWPLVALRDLNIGLLEMMRIGVKDLFHL